MNGTYRQGLEGRRVPSFQGNDRLEFTDEEQQAIRDAEEALGYRTRPRGVARPHRSGNGLAIVIALLGAAFLFLSILITVANAIHTEDDPAGENEISTATYVEPAPPQEDPYPVFAEQEIRRNEDLLKGWYRLLRTYVREEINQQRAEVERCNERGVSGYSCLPSDDLKKLILQRSVAEVGREDASQVLFGMEQANRSVVAGERTVEEAKNEFESQTAQFAYDKLDSVCFADALKDEPEVKATYESRLTVVRDSWRDNWAYQSRREYLPPDDTSAGEASQVCASPQTLVPGASLVDRGGKIVFASE